MEFFGANILVLDLATSFLTRLIQSTLTKYTQIPILTYPVLRPPSIPHTAGLLKTSLPATDILPILHPPSPYLSTQQLQSGGPHLKKCLQAMSPAHLQSCLEYQALHLHQEIYREPIPRALLLAACPGYQDRRIPEILPDEISNAIRTLTVDLRVPYYRKIRIYMRDTLIRFCRKWPLQEAHSRRR